MTGIGEGGASGGTAVIRKEGKARTGGRSCRLTPISDGENTKKVTGESCVVCRRWRGTARRVWAAAHGWAWARKTRDCSKGGVQAWASWRRVAPRQVDYDEGPAGGQFVRSPRVTLSSSPPLLPLPALLSLPAAATLALTSTLSPILLSLVSRGGALTGPRKPSEPASPSTCSRQNK